MDRTGEFEHKAELLRRLSAEHGKAAVLVGTQANFAWLTGGGENRVNIATESGAGDLLVTRDKAWLVASNIEAPRLAVEEVAGLPLETLEFPWYRPAEKVRLFREIASPEQCLSDQAGYGSPVNLSPLHFPLLETEFARYRQLGALAARALTAAAGEIRPGQTEHEAAAVLAAHLLAVGAVPTVILVAADERARRYRHPLPTDRRIERWVMLVACARKHGLIASLTRLVSFGRPSPDLVDKQRAAAEVDAALISATRPGVPLKNVFETAVEAYRAAGFPDEWRRHHQGGPTGYQGRYRKATPASADPVPERSAFAWNPSVSGAKSEDTVLIQTGREAEIITLDPAWPTIDIRRCGTHLKRPWILEK